MDSSALQPSPVVNIADVARDVARPLQSSFRSFALYDHCPAVQVDVPSVERILKHLLINSATHAPDSDVAVSITYDCPWIEIIVEDNGPGIPEELQNMVFDPFSHGFNILHKGKRVGIGLAIVQEYAQMNGGDVTVAHAPSGGVRARVRLRGR